MDDEKQALIAELEKFEIEHDKRWGVDRLRAALEAETEEVEAEVAEEPVEAAEPAPRSDMVMVRVLRDYWPTDSQEDRIRKGTLQEVSALEALDGIESGTLERVKS